MAPEKSASSLRRPLHNFKLPGFSWGMHRIQHCMKVESASGGQIPVGSDRQDDGTEPLIVNSGEPPEKRPEFSVALSRSEIEADIVVLTGRKPSRRLQKRQRRVQKTLDALFPGLGLTEISADMYKTR